jgi:hypothetical protein
VYLRHGAVSLFVRGLSSDHYARLSARGGERPVASAFLGDGGEGGEMKEITLEFLNWKLDNVTTMLAFLAVHSCAGVHVSEEQLAALRGEVREITQDYIVEETTGPRPVTSA